MDYDNDDAMVGLTGNDRLIFEARRDFLTCQEWQGKCDEWSLDDTKFAWADSRNGWQWPQKLYQDRSGENGEDRPSLTINKTRVHNDIIINEAMKNKSSIKIRPTGGLASYDAAQAMQTLIRRIEYVSKASTAYRTVFEHQVDGGIGYIILETAYVSDRSFDQEIFLRAARDPRAVYLDPNSREPDGSDADFGFVFERMSRLKFNRKYPKWRNEVGKSALGADAIWMTDKEILVCTYHKRKGTPDTFISYVEETSGKRIEKLASEIEKDAGPEILKALLEDIKEGRIDGKTRHILDQSVKSYFIAGDKVISVDDWAGKYIPICRCVGREMLIDGKLDRKGHTRALIDAQRMLNYNASGSVEFGALQPKVPFIGPDRAFEGHEQVWKDINRKNFAYAGYNDIDDEAADPALAKIDKPERVQPPQSAPVYMEGAQIAERWMMMVSGQYQAQLGENDQQSAASGRAISERQRQGDTATFHFAEHQSDMLRFIGVQLLDLIPKIYDTERELQVLNEDGTEALIRIIPDQEEAVRELKEIREGVATLAFNPKVGQYDCISDPGPNYATQRQEAWNAITLILQQNMELAATIGDLLFKFGDFPGSEEIRERLRKEIEATKPYLFDDEKSPGIVAAQQQVQQLMKLNGELMSKIAEMQLKLRGREEKRDIDASNAETKRLEVLVEAMAKIVLTPADRARMEHELTSRTHDANLDMIAEANKAAIAGLNADSGANGAASQ